MTPEQIAYFSRLQDKAALAQIIIKVASACMADDESRDLAFNMIDHALGLVENLNIGLDVVNLPKGVSA